MPWTDSFLTGIALVDTQHRSLVDLVNRAAGELARGAPRGVAVAAVLDDLFAYADFHFHEETALMSARGIDARHLEHHLGSHAAFVLQLGEMRRDFDAGNGLSGEDLLHFLASWLALHILDEDQRMARQLHAIEAGQSPAEAFDAAEGSRAVILQNVNHVLVSSMLALFDSMTRHNRELNQKNAELSRAHAEIGAHRDRLETLVEARTAELARTNVDLARARDAAEDASRAKTRFLGNLSHDLLTPLNAILGFAHLLGEAGLPARESAQVARIARAGEHLNGVLAELLLYSRLESAPLDVQAREFRPAAILAQVQERIARAARSRGVQVRLDTERDIPPLVGAEQQLAEAMGALAGNAVRGMDAGTLVLAARSRTTRAGQLRLELRVRAEGFSLQPEQRSAIDHALDRLDAARTGGRGGVGLGFGLAAEIARRLGGTLDVDSAGNGSTQFTLAVELPVAGAEAQAAAASATPGQDFAAARERIGRLLREDDMEARACVRELEAQLRAGLGDGVTDALMRRVQDYDFAGALELLREPPA